jgi:hypothetical protein
LPLATPEVDPERIFRKGKPPREGIYAAKLGISDDFHCPPLENPISASHSPIRLSIGVTRSLKFGSVLVEFSPPGMDLEGEILFTPLSPKFVPWSRPQTLEDFPTPGFITPPPVGVTHFSKKGILCSL